MKNARLAILLLVFIYISCTKYSYGKKQQTEIPQHIYTQAENIIIDRVGEDYYHRNFKYLPGVSSGNQIYERYDDLTKSRKVVHEENYYLVWHFEVIDKPYISKDIIFHITENGELINPLVLKYIPNCNEDPRNCEFSVTRERAVELALKAGLDRGTKPWQTTVMWKDKGGRKGYYWIVSMSDGKYNRDAYINMIDESVELGVYETVEY